MRVATLTPDGNFPNLFSARAWAAQPDHIGRKTLSSEFVVVLVLLEVMFTLVGARGVLFTMYSSTPARQPNYNIDLIVYKCDRLQGEPLIKFESY